MRIELLIDGKEKVFIADFIPARVFRQAIQAQRILNKEEIKEEDLDLVLNIIVNAFGKQFTLDQVYDGLDARTLIETITSTITSIISGVSEDTH